MKAIFAGGKTIAYRIGKLTFHNDGSCFRLQLHGAIYRPDSFVLMLRYCANLKAIRYESMSLNRIVADKSHRVIAALNVYRQNRLTFVYTCYHPFQIM